jgi:hypothetical protein
MADSISVFGHGNLVAAQTANIMGAVCRVSGEIKEAAGYFDQAFKSWWAGLGRLDLLTAAAALGMASTPSRMYLCLHILIM